MTDPVKAVAKPAPGLPPGRVPPDPQSLDDASLMLAIGAGEATAFRLLVERHIAPMTRFAANLTGEASVADDMVQQTFVQLWRSAPGWRPEAEPRAWLYKVMRNECLQHLRRRRPHLSLVTDGEEREIADDRALPDDRMAADQRNAALDAAMARLPERQRTALLLRFGEGLSQREAAAVMGLGERALESLVARGKQRLKEWLSGD